VSLSSSDFSIAFATFSFSSFSDDFSSVHFLDFCIIINSATRFKYWRGAEIVKIIQSNLRSGIIKFIKLS
jgi:hypothetical protein